VNANQVAKTLANEWGFYYSVTSNFTKVKEFANKCDALPSEDRMAVTQRIDKLNKIIEETPKSLAWRLRAKAGPAVKWYNVVEEVQR
jgi:hypothetical protein